MSDGGSEDTNGRSEPGIGFGFRPISRFSNECMECDCQVKKKE